MSSVNASGPVGPDDRVEDQPVDVAREGARVLQRDVRAVGDPHERELVGAQAHAQRLEVEHGVGGRVGDALRPDALGAVLHGARPDRVQRAQPLHVVAADDARLARAALVERHEAVAAQRRLEAERERRGGVEARLTRAAGQRDEHAPPRREVALGGELDPHRAADAPAAVERDRQRPAQEVRLVLAGARRARLRAGRGRREPGRRQGDEDGGGEWSEAAWHWPAHATVIRSLARRPGRTDGPARLDLLERFLGNTLVLT